VGLPHREIAQTHSGCTTPGCPQWAPRPAQLSMPHSVDTPTFHGRAFSQARGCFEHTEFSTVSAMVDSGGGQGLHKACVAQGHRPWVSVQVLQAKPLWPPVKEAFGRSHSHHQQNRTIGSRSILPRVESSITPHRVRHRATPRRSPVGMHSTEWEAGHSADLLPSSRLQVF